MDIKAILSDAIVKTAQQAIAAGVVKEGTLPEVQLTVPPKKEFGDFATNFAMQSARALRCNPRVLAQYIVDHLDCAYVKRMEIAGPGFLNFYLDPDWVYDMLAHIVEAGENYGNLPKASDERIQVEYVSANPTGPLHVGHGRGAAVGSALSNLLKAAGYDVEQEYYINDAGNQMNNLARSVNARYLELLGQTCEFPEDGYHGHDIIDTAQRIIDKYGDRFLKMEEDERLEQFKTIAYQEKLAALKEDLERFNVRFDVWFSEKTLHEANKINEACEYLLEKGYMEERDGA
ncbi:MAG: arginine--tRNA ligase, partial [Acidaminococcaceae bacterium]|nr:arginine--tRNA ligase [Acidaminococcaceae bacterium]